MFPGFVIEYKTSSAGPAVRLLNHDPNPIDAHVIYRVPFIYDRKPQVKNEMLSIMINSKLLKKNSYLIDWSLSLQPSKSKIMGVYTQ